MPEGPEVRKYADAVDRVLAGRTIVSLEARTRVAKDWLALNEGRLTGRQVLRVLSHGKHLLGFIEGGSYFHSHLMMWGRWQTFGSGIAHDNKRKKADRLTTDSWPTEKDRRERARIIVNGGAAILMSAPIFNIGEGDPYQQIENLKTLGPDVLPYPTGARGRRLFNAAEFRRRLMLPPHLDITIGAALLNQRILAGLGNYLRSEILFACRLDPWLKVGALSQKHLRCLSIKAPELSLRAYLRTATAADEDRERMRNDPTLVYQPGREMGTRHLVFRRTNLPCLRCGLPVKQLRQPTYNPDGYEEDGERTRIVYFCASCQQVDFANPPVS